MIDKFNEGAILRKIKHFTFARTLLWLNERFHKEGRDVLIYTSDLRKELKMYPSWIYNILIQFVDVGLLKRIYTSSTHMYFKVECNGDRPLLADYVSLAEKTCGESLQNLKKKFKE